MHVWWDHGVLQQLKLPTCWCDWGWWYCSACFFPSRIGRDPIERWSYSWNFLFFFPLQCFSNSPCYEGSRLILLIYRVLTLFSQTFSKFSFLLLLWFLLCQIHAQHSHIVNLSIKYQKLGRCYTTNTILENKSVTECDLNHCSHFKRIIDTLSLHKSYKIT